VDWAVREKMSQLAAQSSMAKIAINSHLSGKRRKQDFEQETPRKSHLEALF
jgi:hypothetical protein